MNTDFSSHEASCCFVNVFAGGKGTWPYTCRATGGKFFFVGCISVHGRVQRPGPWSHCAFWFENTVQQPPRRSSNEPLLVVAQRGGIWVYNKKNSSEQKKQSGYFLAPSLCISAAFRTRSNGPHADVLVMHTACCFGSLGARLCLFVLSFAQCSLPAIQSLKLLFSLRSAVRSAFPATDCYACPGNLQTSHTIMCIEVSSGDTLPVIGSNSQRSRQVLKLRTAVAHIQP